MSFYSHVWKQDRKWSQVSEVSVVEKQEEAAQIYVDRGMLTEQRHVHGRARQTWRIQNLIALIPTSCCWRRKANAHVQQEAISFPHGRAFGNAFNLSSIFASKKVIEKALVYSPETHIKHTITQHTQRGWNLITTLQGPPKTLSVALAVIQQYIHYCPSMSAPTAIP